MRFVIVPQAVRRVLPPLLNDFIALQKDVALVSFLGIVEAEPKQPETQRFLRRLLEARRL
jgi:ABC-type amino acid transport system permease subunit